MKKSSANLTNEGTGNMKDYIQKLDEIDQWLYESLGILPGACSSQENLRHTTARMVAEALWPHALTWKDIDKIQQLYVDVMTEAGGTPMDFAEETLRRFNEQRNK